ncbi:cobalamin biosynthesis protein [Phyllobacterium bourgognense]|uniref:Cobalt-precorrin 5A hydrolase/precorrin-3B C17-methyltransferase n=1 Tax=Phyllobacterium bourgognense TaxID=314236 RepID=A0A368Z1C7_9HYPH|nr:cobalamin biosynthesis protein [Phyllobacterium bourgognense]RCW86231.1 cobalt-precorrin 5A hydrolase/precorrin-3B C17-methyltransferase [Phyllobacterium bourgognense]
MTSPIYALGVGCERGCAPDELFDLVNKVLQNAAIEPSNLSGIHSIDLRRGEPAIVDVARKFSRPVCYFSASFLEEQTPSLLNPSDRVFALMGCHGVAEAAALAGVGPTGVLVVGKTKSAHATAALAVTKR